MSSCSTLLWVTIIIIRNLFIWFKTTCLISHQIVFVFISNNIYIVIWKQPPKFNQWVYTRNITRTTTITYVRCWLFGTFVALRLREKPAQKTRQPRTSWRVKAVSIFHMPLEIRKGLLICDCFYCITPAIVATLHTHMHTHYSCNTYIYMHERCAL